MEKTVRITNSKIGRGVWIFIILFFPFFGMSKFLIIKIGSSPLFGLVVPQSFSCEVDGNDVPVGTRSPSAGGRVNPTARADLRAGGCWGGEGCILSLGFSEDLPPSPGRQHGNKDPQIPSSLWDNNKTEHRKWIQDIFVEASAVHRDTTRQSRTGARLAIRRICPPSTVSAHMILEQALNFSFLICKTGIIITASPTFRAEDQRRYYVWFAVNLQMYRLLGRWPCLSQTELLHPISILCHYPDTRTKRSFSTFCLWWFGSISTNSLTFLPSKMEPNSLPLSEGWTKWLTLRVAR